MARSTREQGPVTPMLPSLPLRCGHRRGRGRKSRGERWGAGWEQGLQGGCAAKRALRAAIANGLLAEYRKERYIEIPYK